ncbi:MAG: peptidase C25, partial [Candidatus Thorarchaeota archaeon]
IYDEFDGVDKPEQIKYFIKHAIEEYGVTYVLLAGGLKSIFYAKARDDPNQGSRDWYVPVRYNNLYDNPQYPLNSEEPLHDPGCISDLYYADVYRYNETSEQNEFESWNPNGDDYFAAWRHPIAENDTDLDYRPDVSLGRLAFRNRLEVKNVVDKIIKYETTELNSEWFEKMTVIGGDGFLDQERLEIAWDTNELPTGKYIIYAQSTNEDNISGPIDEVDVLVDKTKDSAVTFNHDDHLLMDDFPNYPARPIATVTSPSCGDILGSTNVSSKPGDGDAYLNERLGWADVDYIDEIMYIRGKSYDPRPYGVTTDMHVWVENEDGMIVFDQYVNDLEMYYEGEWVTGERLLNGGGGALYYMPENFTRDILWPSNGRLTGPHDVIHALSEGAGFVFFSGHGSPNVWANHYPGVPGNRQHGDVEGLSVTGISIWPGMRSRPLAPMNKIKNYDKLPVAVVGGCHNGMFNVSMIPCLLDIQNKHNMHSYGTPIPSCFCWNLVKLRGRGAIASIGNTGYGYGVPGKDCTSLGLDGGICIEFFKQYGTNGHEVLGDAYIQTQNAYVDQFDMEFMDHAKSLTQWVLFGDPSLMLGGYE